MYCKDCKSRFTSEDDDPICISENLVEDEEYDPNGKRLIYSYPEDGRFYVEDYFGCVHFEPKMKTDYELAMEEFNKGQ